MFSLKGRSALITGAASGIGAATAHMFAQAGADLALGWYPPDGYDIGPVLRDAIGTGSRAMAGELDVRDSGSVGRLTEQAVDTLGRLDIVVANAGIARIERRPEE